jgi:hypothetical protein
LAALVGEDLSVVDSSGWIEYFADIDLLNEARKPLHGYLNLDKEHGDRTPESPFSLPDSGEGSA